MLIDLIIYWLLIWGLVAALNASVFKKQPASRTTAWVLTIAMFFVNLLALTVLRVLQYKAISQDLGIDIKPTGPARFGGAFAASWFFFILLRKVPRKSQLSPELTIQSSSPPVSPIASSAPSPSSPQCSDYRDPNMITTPTCTIDPNVVDEDRIYALIADEIEARRPEKGLWTRLFAECGGDEKQTRVLYIKQRAERLIEAEKARIESEARERATDAERKEKLRLEGLSLREKLASQNISKELTAQIADLSRTHDAVTFLNKVRLNKQDDVLALLNKNPLLAVVSNSEGDTALHIALREKYAGMIRLLIEKGARADIPNAYGVTPLELASKSGQPELVSLLAVVA